MATKKFGPVVNPNGPRPGMSIEEFGIYWDNKKPESRLSFAPIKVACWEWNQLTDDEQKNAYATYCNLSTGNA